MAGWKAAVSLPTGDQMPLMAFGTLMGTLDPEFAETVDIIENAIDVGYRHLDTALIYNTEQHVGEAVRNKIKQGVITRKDMFITTKLWRNAYGRQDVVPSLKKSLERMGLSYVDLFLIHWPTAFKSGAEIFPKDELGKFEYEAIDYMYIETWKGMEECVDLGLAKAIGVSNFNSKQIQRILNICKHRPANNQIECHPYLSNSKIIDFCQSRGITVMAYAPLFGFNKSLQQEKGWPSIYTDEMINSVAKKNKRTPAQVALKYQLQRQVGVAPKSTNRNHMEENFQALDFTLSPEDMKSLLELNKNLRLNAEFPDHPYYPFHEEF